MDKQKFRTYVHQYSVYVALAAVGLSLFFHVSRYVFGPLTADHYYQPIAEFVEPDKIRDMENTVFEIHKAASTRHFWIHFILHVAALSSLCLLLWVQTSTQPPPLRR